MKGAELTRRTNAHWEAWRTTIRLGEPQALWALARLRVAILIQPVELTLLERDTLHLITQGHTEKEVGELLSCGRDSIRKRTARIRLKLNARSTLQAATIARKAGML